MPSHRRPWWDLNPLTLVALLVATVWARELLAVPATFAPLLLFGSACLWLLPWLLRQARRTRPSRDNRLDDRFPGPQPRRITVLAIYLTAFLVTSAVVTMGWMVAVELLQFWLAIARFFGP